jgi:predicted ribosomally synthesized peptide with SipW-like signal peptide
MKNKNTKNERRNKRKFLIVTGISALTILGGTLAYFTTSDTIQNIFKTALYQHQIVEKFESPSDWTPGTTTEKTIKVTNTGSISMAVRASYTEQWVTSNGNEIPLKDSENNVAAIINFNKGWTKSSDGYYYYGSKDNMTKVAPGETTSSFISGVTFNGNITASLNKTVSADGQTITYTSTGNGYDNATYKLTVKIDTIQYDQAGNIW